MGRSEGQISGRMQRGPKHKKAVSRCQQSRGSVFTYIQSVRAGRCVCGGGRGRGSGKVLARV